MNRDSFNLQVLFEDTMKPAKSQEEIAKKYGVSVEDVTKALDKGQKVEMEHTKDAETARIIASHHLDEMLDYYDKLAKMES